MTYNPSSGPVLLGQTVLAATAATISFSSIPATYEALRLVFTGRTAGDPAGTNRDGLRLRLNSDSSAIYDSWGVYGTNTAAGVFGLAAQTSSRVGDMPDVGAGAGRAGQVVIDIAGYARTTFYKNVVGTSTCDANPASNPERISAVYGGLWRSSAAITAVTLLPETGSFDIGTVATLYGIP